MGNSNTDWVMGDFGQTSAILAGYLVEHVARIIEKARSLAPTKRIAANIQTVPLTQSENQASSGIYIQTDKDHAPEACAYEYGSGLHDPAGAHTIRIPGQGSGPVAFHWNNADKYGPKGAGKPSLTKDGKYVFSYVNHPGVVARPYMLPAVVDEAEPLMRDLENALDSLWGPDSQQIILHMNL